MSYKVLKEKKLNGLIVKTVNDDSVEAGKIVQQSPAPNAEAKKEQMLSWQLVWAKIKQFKISQMLNLEKVEGVLKKKQFDIGEKLKRKYDDKVDENKVISQV